MRRDSSSFFPPEVLIMYEKSVIYLLSFFLNSLSFFPFFNARTWQAIRSKRNSQKIVRELIRGKQRKKERVNAIARENRTFLFNILSSFFYPLIDRGFYLWSKQYVREYDYGLVIFVGSGIQNNQKQRRYLRSSLHLPILIFFSYSYR